MRIKESLRNVIAWTVVFVGSVTPVSADGGFFWADADTVTQVRQTALIVSHVSDGISYLTYVLSSDYEGDPDDFGWVVPVHELPVDDPIFVDPEVNLFDSLDEHTVPRFIFREPVDLYTRCACSAELGYGDEQSTAGDLVTVVRQGSAGVLEFAILSASDPEALFAWLDENGYPVPDDTQIVLERYISDEFHFVAFRVSESELPDDVSASVNIPPVQFTVESTEVIYPMAISSISAAPETEVLIYVLADSVYVPVEQTAIRVDDMEVSRDSKYPGGTDYSEVFRETVDDTGPGSVIVEYAGDWPSWVWPEAPFGQAEDLVLTRMRALLTPDEMTFDYSFLPSPDFEMIQDVITLGAPSARDVALTFAFYGFFPLAYFTRKVRFIRLHEK